MIYAHNNVLKDDVSSANTLVRFEVTEEVMPPTEQGAVVLGSNHVLYTEGVAKVVFFKKDEALSSPGQLIRDYFTKEYLITLRDFSRRHHSVGARGWAVYRSDSGVFEVVRGGTLSAQVEGKDDGSGLGQVIDTTGAGEVVGFTDTYPGFGYTVFNDNDELFSWSSSDNAFTVPKGTYRITLKSFWDVQSAALPATGQYMTAEWILMEKTTGGWFENYGARHTDKIWHAGTDNVGTVTPGPMGTMMQWDKGVTADEGQFRFRAKKVDTTWYTNFASAAGYHTSFHIEKLSF